MNPRAVGGQTLGPVYTFPLSPYGICGITCRGVVIITEIYQKLTLIKQPTDTTHTDNWRVKHTLLGVGTRLSALPLRARMSYAGCE